MITHSLCLQESCCITKQPAYITHYVNGFALSGSIINTNYQGGNYWNNFNGAIPYNNGGFGLVYCMYSEGIFCITTLALVLCSRTPANTGNA